MYYQKKLGWFAMKNIFLSLALIISISHEPVCEIVKMHAFAKKSSTFLGRIAPIVLDRADIDPREERPNSLLPNGIA